MLQTVARIKPFSLAKIYGLLSATVTLLLGLILNAITVFWGQNAVSFTWQSFTAENQLMIHTLKVKPLEILLFTCVLTVVVLIIGMIYGLILAWLYNFSAGLGGGVQLEMLAAPTRVPATNVPAPAKTAAVPVAAPKKSTPARRVAKTTKKKVTKRK